MCSLPKTATGALAIPSDLSTMDESDVVSFLGQNPWLEPVATVEQLEEEASKYVEYDLPMEDKVRMHKGTAYSLLPKPPANALELDITWSHLVDDDSLRVVQGPAVGQERTNTAAVECILMLYVWLRAGLVVYDQIPQKPQDQPCHTAELIRRLVGRDWSRPSLVAANSCVAVLRNYIRTYFPTILDDPDKEVVLQRMFKVVSGSLRQTAFTRVPLKECKHGHRFTGTDKTQRLTILDVGVNDCKNSQEIAILVNDSLTVDAKVSRRRRNRACKSPGCVDSLQNLFAIADAPPLRLAVFGTIGDLNQEMFQQIKIRWREMTGKRSAVMYNCNAIVCWNSSRYSLIFIPPDSEGEDEDEDDIIYYGGRADGRTEKMSIQDVADLNLGIVGIIYEKRRARN